jgi:hypothetical protein
MSNYQRYQVLSVNDDQDFCQCCGKTGLKRVVFIRDTETDEVKHFGTTCAMSPVKGFGIDKEIKAAINRAEDYEKRLNSMTGYEYRKNGGAYIDAINERGLPVRRPANLTLWQQYRAHFAERGFNY